MVYKGTVWNLKTRIRYEQDNPGLRTTKLTVLSVKTNICLWMFAYLFPLWVMSLLQVSICTSNPLFILHISMYSWRWRFMSDFAVANSNYRETYCIKTGLMGCYTYTSVHIYSLVFTMHLASSINYKKRVIQNIWFMTVWRRKITVLQPWQDVF